MAIALFDTNILIDCLKGYPLAIKEVAYWDDAVISAISWMEIMAGSSDDDRAAISDFLGSFEVIHTDGLIMQFAATLRAESIQQRKKVLLPDAIIMATGAMRADLIITRNAKDFRLVSKVRTPYELTATDPVEFVNVVSPPALTPLEAPPTPL